MLRLCDVVAPLGLNLRTNVAASSGWLQKKENQNIISLIIRSLIREVIEDVSRVDVSVLMPRIRSISFC